jgi:hypothetical protein
VDIGRSSNASTLQPITEVDDSETKWTNNSMDKQDGKVTIFTKAFNPYEANEQRIWTRQLLGSDIKNLTQPQILEIETWYEHLRVQAGTYCCSRIGEEMMTIVRDQKLGY